MRNLALFFAMVAIIGLSPVKAADTTAPNPDLARITPQIVARTIRLPGGANAGNSVTLDAVR